MTFNSLIAEADDPLDAARATIIMAKSALASDDASEPARAVARKVLLFNEDELADRIRASRSSNDTEPPAGAPENPSSGVTPPPVPDHAEAEDDPRAQILGIKTFDSGMFDRLSPPVMRRLVATNLAMQHQLLNSELANTATRFATLNLDTAKLTELFRSISENATEVVRHGEQLAGYSADELEVLESLLDIISLDSDCDSALHPSDSSAASEKDDTAGSEQ